MRSQDPRDRLGLHSAALWGPLSELGPVQVSAFGWVWLGLGGVRLLRRGAKPQPTAPPLGQLSRHFAVVLRLRSLLPSPRRTPPRDPSGVCILGLQRAAPVSCWSQSLLLLVGTR